LWVPQVQEKIVHFFHTIVRDKFPAQNYVFDVVATPQKILIVDFSEWNETTDSCLFDWEELSNLGSHGDVVDFRVIEHETGIQPNQSLTCRVPFDLKDYSSEGALKQYLENMSMDQLKKMAEND